MNLFTEVYNKSKELLQKPCFDKRWSNIEAKAKALLADGGFSEADAPVLDLIRQSLNMAAKGRSDFGAAVAEEIVKLSRPTEAGFQDRAALIKTLRHIYLVVRRGRQSIWAVDHPKTYDKWVYDKTNGLSTDKLQEQLARTREAFGSENRAMFSTALQLARKISMDTCVKIANKDKRTQRKIRKWFLEKGASKEDAEKVREVLLDGFKKISALCNTNTVIFSDRPHKRVDPGYANTKAAVNKGDKMPVIYIFRMFLDYGKKNLDGVHDRLWQCAKTIIHELSHKILSTDDHAYGVNGIKPGVSVTVADAIKNADSWGIFALDVAGFLPDDVGKEAYS